MCAFEQEKAAGNGSAVARGGKENASAACRGVGNFLTCPCQERTRETKAERCQ